MTPNGRRDVVTPGPSAVTSHLGVGHAAPSWDSRAA